MTIVSLALSIVACFAVSEDGDIVKNVAWATGELSNVVNKNVSDAEVPLEVTLHIGLSAVVQESKFDDSADTSQTIKWDDVDTCGADYCQDCKDTATGTASTAIIACVTKFPAGGLMVKRRVPRTDCYFFKFMSMVSTFMGLITLVSSLLSFSDDCWTSFPDSIEIVVGDNMILSGDASYSAGPGFLCLLAAVFFDCFVALVHILTPVPKDEQDSGNTVVQVKHVGA
ncbi:hypothetical protein CYMTET_20894 [Cymbomonas tetramitiformis]|uniref:Uncharacterized protein n=1 Tax=Cymbomonas tetramitiformis TaxID=36881 RepID=A0AAE0L3P7_9CHLO|nr:hypothetical protein CYMTET_20894 [Cymbomonas tetramitiformis]